MRKSKYGVSLIVLVIIIIVMIILASAIIISLKNMGIINKATDAVEKNDENQVQHIASLIWTEAYLEGLRDDALTNKVKTELYAHNIKEDKWLIDVTNTGVIVKNINSMTLDKVLTPDDYGKKIDYKANGVEDWQILYVDRENGYVFLIASKCYGYSPLKTDKSVASLREMSNTNKTFLEIYNIFRLNNTKYVLTDTYINNKAVVDLITGYSDYANTELYGSNVVGAMGGPTVELLFAAYNEKRNDDIGYTIDLSNPNGKYGYFLDWISEDRHQASLPFEITLQNYYYCVATPSAKSEDAIFAAGYGFIHYYPYTDSYLGIRPVVCLKSNIPAVATEDGYSLIVNK